MKVLTLTQPWATLVAIGAKRIETRSWKTNYRGKLAIHAAKTVREEELDLCYSDPFREALISSGLYKEFPVWSNSFTHKITAREVNPKLLPFGRVIAICDLVECIHIETRKPARVTRFWMETSREEDGTLNHNYMAEELDILVPPQPESPEAAFGNYLPGRYAWILANIYKLEYPIPAKGNLGLWEFPGL